MKSLLPYRPTPLDRRSFLKKAVGAAVVPVAGLGGLTAAEPLPQRDPGANYLKEVAENERLARSKDAQPMIGLGDKLKITLAAGLHLAASIPNFLCQEQSSLGVGYLKKPFQVREGYIDIPTGPGLGVELDENALANKLDHDWRNRETYDVDDGSVVDW